MRNLCTIQKVKSLTPIEGKDKIVLAHFESTGWTVIVDKNEVKVGDRVVYCEYDTLLPPKPEFEFLRKRCWNDKWGGFRITAMKMAGCLSEGIVFPLNMFPDIIDPTIHEGEDVTGAIGAKKYDPELLEEQATIKEAKHGKIVTMLLRIPAFKKWMYPKKVSGRWPTYIKKSDETRAQSLNYIFDPATGLYDENRWFYITEKVDGKSTTYAYLKKGLFKDEFVVCSRNNRYPHADPTVDHWRWAINNDMKGKMKKLRKAYGSNIYIQGELLGPKIQGNKYLLKELKFVAYAMYDIKRGEYVGFGMAKALCESVGIEWVPVINALTPFQWKNIEELLALSKGPATYNMNTPREGIVIRSANYQPPMRGMSNQLSFKVINPSFIEKWGL